MSNPNQQWLGFLVFDGDGTVHPPIDNSKKLCYIDALPADLFPCWNPEHRYLKSAFTTA
jgi:hypothetical protein